MVLSIAILPILSGFLLYNAVCFTKQIFVLRDDETAANINHTTAKGYSVTVENIDRSLRGLRDVAYSPRELQNTIAEELLKSGMSIDNFSVKPVPNKTKRLPAAGGAGWKDFNFSTVTLSGIIDKDKVADFIIFLGTRQKIWYISSFEMHPLDTPAEFVFKFNKMFEDISTQNRNSERDAQVDLIGNRPYKNTLGVSLTFFVPVRTGDDQ
jgi:hypothetical protein